MDYLGNDLVSLPILVTGASGYLGSCIVKQLTLKKTRVVSVASKRVKEGIEVCDLTSQREIIKLLQKVKPKSIIHCAAAVPKELNGSINGYQDANAAAESLNMALNLAEIARCPIVFVSSMAIYDNGESLKNPVQEEDVELAPAPSSHYAIGKHTAEIKMAELTNYGLICLRLPGLFGKPRTSGILYNAARAFILGKEFKILNTPLWAAMHVDDAASVCIKAAEMHEFPKSDIVNIGYDEKFNIVNAVNMVSKICGFYWKGGLIEAPSFQMDLEKSKKYILYQNNTLKDRLISFVEDVKTDLNFKNGS
jgi:nucleoside-diphosphate-sugar epimerase